MTEDDAAVANGAGSCCCLKDGDEGFDETDGFAGCDIGSRRH